MRAKFEEWEESQDARDQLAQMAAYDENGEPLETASILRKKFEALRMHEEEANKTPTPIKAQFRPKRFKVSTHLVILEVSRVHNVAFFSVTRLLPRLLAFVIRSACTYQPIKELEPRYYATFYLFSHNLYLYMYFALK